MGTSGHDQVTVGISADRSYVQVSKHANLMACGSFSRGFPPKSCPPSSAAKPTYKELYGGGGGLGVYSSQLVSQL